MHPYRALCLRATSGAAMTPARIIITLAALLLAALPSRAEPNFSLDSAPGKLPKTVQPTHYAIELKPDLDKLVVVGSEAVDIEVA